MMKVKFNQNNGDREPRELELKDYIRRILITVTVFTIALLSGSMIHIVNIAFNSALVTDSKLCRDSNFKDWRIWVII